MNRHRQVVSPLLPHYRTLLSKLSTPQIVNPPRRKSFFQEKSETFPGVPVNVGQQPSSERECFGSLSTTVKLTTSSSPRFLRVVEITSEAQLCRDDAHLLFRARLLSTVSLAPHAMLQTSLLILRGHCSRSLCCCCLQRTCAILQPCVRCMRVATSSMCDRHAVACLLSLSSLAGASTRTNTALEPFENAAFMDMCLSLQMLYNHTVLNLVMR